MPYNIRAHTKCINHIKIKNRFKVLFLLFRIITNAIKFRHVSSYLQKDI